MKDSTIIIENFIAGTYFTSRKYIDSYSPATGVINAKIPDSGHLEVDAAVAAAKRAFPGWSRLSAQKRGEYLLKVADLLEKRMDEFAELESQDQGKPLWLAKKVDIPRAVSNFRHFASTIPHILGTSKMLTDSQTSCITIRSPVGVAGVISPWNLPIYLLTFKIAPALMTGNTVVAKPSEMTSVTAYKLCELFKEAGIPDGVVNIVFGLGSSVGEALVRHPDVPLISFTGSTATGKRIAITSAPMFKKLSLEMGGKNPAIVFKDCDMESTLDTLINGSFLNSGQICLCTSRIFVHKDIFEEFLSEFVERARNLKVGDSSDNDNFMGPLNSKLHLEKVKSYVKIALEEGGTVHCGETVDKLLLKEENKNGYFMRPTVITGLKDDATCMQEEMFGPVTCLTPFDTEEEAIRRANDTIYGLSGCVFTSNIGIAHRVSDQLQVGTVWTNGWLIRDMDLPFGGYKGSGLGREGTKESYEFFTQIKAICTKID